MPAMYLGMLLSILLMALTITSIIFFTPESVQEFILFAAIIVVAAYTGRWWGGA